MYLNKHFFITDINDVKNRIISGILISIHKVQSK